MIDVKLKPRLKTPGKLLCKKDPIVFCVDVIQQYIMYACPKGGRQDEILDRYRK
jgi:hypothetical protein